MSYVKVNDSQTFFHFGSILKKMCQIIILSIFPFLGGFRLVITYQNIVLKNGKKNLRLSHLYPPKYLLKEGCYSFSQHKYRSKNSKIVIETKHSALYLCSFSCFVICKGPLKYYVIKEVGGWGQKMAIFDDLQYCKSSKRWVGGPKKVRNMMT